MILPLNFSFTVCSPAGAWVPLLEQPATAKAATITTTNNHAILFFANN
jgi:hypothetical protein